MKKKRIHKTLNDKLRVKTQKLGACFSLIAPHTNSHTHTLWGMKKELKLIYNLFKIRLKFFFFLYYSCIFGRWWKSSNFQLENYKLYDSITWRWWLLLLFVYLLLYYKLLLMKMRLKSQSGGRTREKKIIIIIRRT